MTALPQDVVADLRRRIAALEQQLQSALTEHDQAVTHRAVMAAENARLLTELRSARDGQSAGAEILRAIGGTSGDAERALQQIAEITARLFDAPSVTIRIAEAGEWVRTIRVGASSKRIGSQVPAAQLGAGARNLPATALRENRQIHVPDLDNVDASMADWPMMAARAEGARTICGTPLRREGKAIGALVIYRDRLAPFTDEELALQQSFADQAAITIENARLVNSTKEALDHQTATAEILKVIASSPSNVQPVFDVIVEHAVRLCGARMGRVYRYDGGVIQMVAGHGLSVPGLGKVQQVFPRPATDDTIVGQVMLLRRPYILADIRIDESVPDLSRQMIEALGTRSQVTMPMLLAGRPIGAITVGWAEPAAYNDQQIALLQTFADQAVIAIENVRMFDEVQARTRDLTEALTYLTGSANILKVIASSPTDVGPVLAAIVQSACELCDANDAAVHLREGDDLRNSAHHGPIPIGFVKQHISRDWVTGRAVVDKVAVHVHDVLSEEGAEFPEAQRLSRRQGTRTVLGVPLLRENESIGAIVLRRTEVNPFSDKQVAMLRTFADQAVIALGNVRLFQEVQERTEDLRESLQFQTATSDVLKVISRSPDSLQPVLDVIVDTSRHLCGTDTSTIFLLRDGKFHLAAASGAMPEYIEFLRANPIALDQAGSSTSRAAREKRTVHIPDIGDDPEFGQGPMAVGQRRALLSVPLMREGAGIGVITMRQSHLTPFTERQIEVVQTFADQAVIAISNVRLFEQVQQRTRELSRSLQDLRTAQDRLVQTEKLASLGQLTAGIAHEIKNPLNFVNNFSALSAELTDELNNVLAPAPLDGATRQEVDELTRLLKDNLEKVVQHGKRADSIVKNMLLHSREGSGDHRPADINALLDESLNLAYHGARAEKPQFNVTLQRDFDDMAGTIEVFPQEITRVFLNLISNGFYAVTKRKAENGGSGFDPILQASTKNLGDAVEIRIRDNGTGIPAEVKEKMFNPFFTTKPAGEGTGLGLSMSHDIIVKQHGGKIDVETKPGEFTEFTIVLPRASNFSNKSRGQT